MSELLNQDGLSVNDIANRPDFQDAARWVQAHRILRLDHKNLMSDNVGDIHYRVTPAVSVEVDGQTNKYRLAVLMYGDTMSETYYLVINDVMRNPIQIGRDATESPLLLASMPGATISTKGIDDILRALDVAARARVSAANDARNTRWLRVIGTAVVLVVLACLVNWMVSCGSHNAEQNRLREAAERAAIADFDAQNIVLKGKRFDIGTSGTLDANAPDFGLSVPNGISLRLQPRMFSVSSYGSSCWYRGNHRINGNQYVLAESNAPDGTISVDIDEDGYLQVCAKDWNPDDALSPTYRVLLQLRQK